MDVEIAISHCGLCYSDIHLIDNDWGVSEYPFVPGHEIVGTVREIGGDVTDMKVGDRVAVGWQRGSCLACDMCLGGDENLCAEHKATCVGHHGGFADAVRLDSRFAHKLPTGLDSANAAPLMCAGITVYSPLREFGIRPSSRVGIIGVGGLGHLAVQFASAFGCEVTAFSSTASKEAETKAFGAHNVVVSTDPDQIAKVASTQDLIISTIDRDLDWGGYINALRPKGTLVFLGAPPSNVSVHAFTLIVGRKAIAGSPIGGRPAMREMLEFAARHDIKATTEIMPMTDINAAIEKVRNNQARYRVVLENPA